MRALARAHPWAEGGAGCDASAGGPRCRAQPAIAGDPCVVLSPPLESLSGAFAMPVSRRSGVQHPPCLTPFGAVRAGHGRVAASPSDRCNRPLWRDAARMAAIGRPVARRGAGPSRRTANSLPTLVDRFLQVLLLLAGLTPIVTSELVLRDGCRGICRSERSVLEAARCTPGLRVSRPLPSSIG